ncbi:WD40-repeat-containing domain protein [Ilyonectria robusta]|uniref:WD40-repeat-containing domain protein n=1 Tax=Ilyonectria robusta TaxID=1079257 RepID=UPI001E8EC2F5|nr:WD40-repeat-containing domain protein [Ilyonectria robusta]KAH8694836.1 WD40-repeat-containing domain protein [Ilyonectria robusta]
MSPLAERYRTTKTSHHLSVQERIMRNDSASVDPFSVQRGAVVPGRDPLSQTNDRALNRVGAILGPVPQNHGSRRQVSRGAVWSVGGLLPGPTRIDEIQRNTYHRGTNSRVFSTSFYAIKPGTQDELEKHEGRIATALDIDRVRKIFDFDQRLAFPRSFPSVQKYEAKDKTRTAWNGYQWVNQGWTSMSSMPTKNRIIPAAPFRILDAPNLKDDFYCSPLAYSFVSQTLAICLGNILYAWTEEGGVNMIHGAHSQTWLTSIAFSSEQGARAILGIGQSDGSLVLRSIYDGLPRFKVQQPFPIACVGWRPTCTLRQSKNPFNPGVLVQTEDLVVGDEMGTLYYYVVEWPMGSEVSASAWPGAVSLVAKITIHSQQICGLAWAPDGKLFTSGGNDNLCCLFEVDRILEQSLIYPAQNENHNPPRPEPFSLGVGSDAGEEASLYSYNTAAPNPNIRADENISEVETFRTSLDSLRHLGSGLERHRWVHGAAVKAMAFCPWRRGLLATGGGSNDKCIHFFHTTSGTALATISVSAQVTSLIWSTTRREIAATFGWRQFPRRAS